MSTPQIPEHQLSTGARPTGAITEQAAADNVQHMFDTIAPTYDISNHILSIGLDRWMWARAARTFRATLQRPQSVVLDLCCGTGDMTLALNKHRPKAFSLQPATQSPGAPSTPQRSTSGNEKSSGAPSMTAPPSWVGLNTANPPDFSAHNPAPILAVDFSHQMLTLGAKKFTGHNIIPIEADALHLPIASNSLDLVTSAFGFRNLANYEAGLAELYRVLRPGGQIGILECNQPEGLIGALYNLYFKGILPRVGGLISGQLSAYRYLPASVERFPRPQRMKQLITQAGFTQARWTSYAAGTAGLYSATKP